MHHARWGDPTKRHVGIGVVEWHSLTEDGKVEIVDIRFGKKLYENVPVDKLEPIEMKEHSHKSKRKKKKSNESMKDILDNMILSKLREEKKGKLIGGQGTKKGKLYLYQAADGSFYMELNGKKADMDPKLAKTRTAAIKAATMFAKMLNAS